jgi:hypothetical protein
VHDHQFGDRDDDPTKPDAPDAILANATLRFVEGARHIGVAVPLLCRLEGNERRYFAGRLAEDVRDFAEAAAAFADLVTFIGGEG